MMTKSAELSQQEKLIRFMRNGTEKLSPQTLADLRALADEPMEEQFDDPDFPSPEHLGEPVIGKFYKPVKKPVTIRLDADILAWFKSNYQPYQRKINEVLRAFAENTASRGGA
jgi:uncharacterized protein (DUF4415 family)